MSEANYLGIKPEFVKKSCDVIHEIELDYMEIGLICTQKFYFNRKDFVSSAFIS
jgi:hypothetical protein